jgi:outer membrane protein TolC
MSFLTGLDPQPPILVVDPLTDPLKPLEVYLTTLENRPDILAAIKTIEIAQSNVKVKKGDLYPQIDFDANYYPYRVGFLRDIKWDATFNMSAPFFNLDTVGKIHEAKSQAKQAEYQAEEVRRKAVTEAKRAYDSFVASQKQYAKYQVATEKAQKSYGLQVQDFSLGLITNVVVLQSQQTWFGALRFRDDAKTNAWLDWLRLQIASGVLP